MRQAFWFVVLALVAEGCAPLATGGFPLTKQAREVRLALLPQVASCELLGYLASEHYGDAPYFASELLGYCSIDLRNQAAKIGATHLVLEPPRFEWRWAAQAAQAFRCGPPPKVAPKKESAADEAWEMKSLEAVKK